MKEPTPKTNDELRPLIRSFLKDAPRADLERVYVALLPAMNVRVKKPTE